MATETTTKNEKADKADNAEEPDETEGAATAPEDTAKASDGTPAAAGADASEADAGTDNGADDDQAEATAAPARSGFAAGAAAVVSAGLGLVSLTGSSIGTMLRERKQLLGQIESGAQGGGGGGADPVNAAYGAPWHSTALVNGIFALIAVALGGLLLAAVAKRADTRPWAKAVALGGLILGAVGLAVAGGMYFDILAPQPELPGTS